nr:hypothetical protein [Tanacetum cinerariifolium]
VTLDKVTWMVYNRLLRYLKATPGQGILIQRVEESISLHVATRIGLDVLSREDQEPVIYYSWEEAPISWKSKKQLVVSRSSAETEYQRGGDDDNKVVVARMKMVVTFDLAVHDFDWFFDEMNLVIELTFISRND